MNYWQELKGNYWTPGGDPAWICPLCGKGQHIYGIENWNEPKQYCSDCKERLDYPFTRTNI